MARKPRATQQALNKEKALEETQNPVTAIELPADGVEELTPNDINAIDRAIDNQSVDVDLAVKEAATPEVVAELAKNIKKVAEVPVAVPVVEKNPVAAKKTVVAPGITITQAKVKGDLQMYVDSGTPEEFIRNKYHLNPEQYSSKLKLIVHGIETYIQNMRSGPIVTPQEGVRHQLAWLRTVLAALDGNYDEASVCFDVILYMASKYRNDLFNARLSCRFFNLMQEGTQRTFLSLQKDIIGAADPRGRKAFLANTNIELTAQRIESPSGRANYLMFFSNQV